MYIDCCYVISYKCMFCCMYIVYIFYIKLVVYFRIMYNGGTQTEEVMLRQCAKVEKLASTLRIMFKFSFLLPIIHVIYI